jgi:hypothetical protein
MGNFSKDPQKVLQDNLGRGYARVRVEQGVPVLDRDLNLMGDLLGALLQSALARYIGTGVATGNNGFLIQGIGAANDFRINAGQILVNGLEATLPAQINYSNQPGVPPLTNAGVGGRVDTVFLDVSLVEVDGTTDNDLLNSGDVGLQTSVRQKVLSVVRVAEGAVNPPPPGAGHTFVSLARLNRPQGATINAANVTDLRQQGLTVAVLEQRMRALEQLHAAKFAPSPNQFAPKTSGAGTNITIFGRNFDISPFTVTFVNNATAAQASATVVGAPTTTQAPASVASL